VASDIKHLKTPKGILLTVTNEGTVANLQIVAAELEEATPDLDKIKQLLKENDVVFGVNEDSITNALSNTENTGPTVIAQGIPVQAGNDATIELLFEVQSSAEPSVDDRGRIDYKNLHFIQNARAGQILARKTPATAGTPGKSVFGTPVAAKPGRDRQLGKGTNTEISSDGLELSATIDGTIAYKFNTVAIHPNENIPASVDTKTGNIDCVGSLKIGKDISSDFTVIAGHNIEVSGNVADAIVQAGGSVMIHGGYFGAGKGKLIAGADVTAKYVENQKIRAGGSVMIGGEALNADIYADDAVYVQGKPGSIIGGSVAAKNLVRAVQIGNEASVPTHIHVAYDMKTVDRLREVGHELERLHADEKRIKDAMVFLYKLEMNGKLPADKKEALDQFKVFIKDMPNLIGELKQEQEQLRAKLQLMTEARIVVEGKAYAGSVLHFGGIYKELMDDEKGPIVFEKAGDTIIKVPLDGNYERVLEEEKKKRKREQPQESESPEGQPVQEQPAVAVKV